MNKKENIYKTYLVYGKNSQKREEKILEFFPENFSKENNPDYLEIKLSDKKKSIGIDEVKAVGQFLQIKPLSYRVKIALIKDANSLTTEAQNSLLKILEEHTNSSIIILEDSSTNFILPTIISRCILEKVVSHNQTQVTIPEKFFELSISEKLDFFDSISKEDKEKIIEILNETLTQLKDRKYENMKEINKKNILLIAETTENLEKFNLSTKLALENLALNLIPIMI